MAKPLNCFLIEMLEGADVARRVIDRNPFLIGRSLEAALPIAEASVSRNHLMVKNKKGEVWISDQASTHGTFLNGEKIEANKWIKVEPKDFVRLGKTGVLLKFSAVERMVSHDFIEGHPDIPEIQKESILDVLDGARSDAEKLVRAARDIHDQVIHKAEGDAKAIEQAAEVREQELLAATETKVLQYKAKLLEEAQKEIAKLHEPAKAEAIAIKQRAEEEAGRLLNESRLQAKNEAEELISSAKKAAKEEVLALKSKAKVEVEEERAKAKEEIDALKSRVDEEVKKLRSNIQAEVKSLRSEAQEEVQKLKDQAKLDIESDRQKMMTEVHRQLAPLRQEKDSTLAKVEEAKKELKELQDLIQKQKKLAQDEIALEQDAARTALELEREEQELRLKTLISDKTEEWERQKKLKEETLQVDIQTKTFAFEKIKIQREEEIKVLNQTLEKLTPQCHELSRSLAELQNGLQSLSAEKQKREAEVIDLKAELSDMGQRKEDLTTSLSELEKKISVLSQSRSELEDSLREEKIQTKKLLAEESQRRDQELKALVEKQNKELHELKRVQIESLQRERQMAIEGFKEERDQLSSEILRILSKAQAAGSPISSDLSGLKSQISGSLEKAGLSLEITGEVGDSGIQSSKKKWQRAQRQFLAQGIAMGLLLFGLARYGYDQFIADPNPMQTMAEEQAKRIQEDLANRRFDPAQDAELRETFRDAVIYTKGFTDIYLRQDLRDQFRKELVDYNLRQWRIEEERSIQVLAMVQTLVESLIEAKAAIHPDFVELGLEKMEKMETEVVERMVETLGSEVRFEAYKRFERKFFETSMVEVRMPAAGDDLESKTETEVNSEVDNEDE